jgi:hypothetical protein
LPDLPENNVELTNTSGTSPWYKDVQKKVTELTEGFFKREEKRRTLSEKKKFNIRWFLCRVHSTVINLPQDSANTQIYVEKYAWQSNARFFVFKNC